MLVHLSHGTLTPAPAGMVSDLLVGQPAPRTYRRPYQAERALDRHATPVPRNMLLQRGRIPRVGGQACAAEIGEKLLQFGIRQFARVEGEAHAPARSAGTARKSAAASMAAPTAKTV